MRSPFLPEIFAQSSGLVVFGRSSCSLNSWLIDSRGRRCGCPSAPPAIVPLDRQLLRPAHDVLDHGARREVLEVHDLLVAVLVGDLEELVRRRRRGTSRRRCARSSPATALSRSPPPSVAHLVRVERQVGREVAARRSAPPPSSSGRSILIFTSRRPGRRMAGSMRSSRFDAPITITFFSVSTPSISASSCGTIVDSMSRADAGAAGAEQRVHLVEEHDDRPALLALLPGPLEHQADLALGLADVLVEQLGALDVEEVAAGRLVARSPRPPSWRASWRPPWR